MDYSSLPDNKYIRCYIRLIESRLGNPKIKGETDLHHIFPISLFGDNKQTVNLSYREHFICHMLLWKGYTKALGSRNILAAKMYKVIYYYRTYQTESGKIIRLNSRGFSTVRASNYIKQSNKKRSLK